MKVAIFHDYFGAIGGGERVALQMAKILGADIITTDTDAVRNIDPTVRVVSLGRTIKVPPLKQISAIIRFFSCDVSKTYDFFILSGNWAKFAARKHHPNMWYCHIILSDLYHQKSPVLHYQNRVVRWGFGIGMFFLNYLDTLSTKWVDCISANSKNLQNKIEVQLGRTSEILYPGIETSNFTYAGNENFWLSLNRLYPEKRIDLQIEAFRRLPEENLTIIGSYAEKDHASPYVKMIMQRLPGNVHVIGEVSETEVQALLSRCKGLVCTSYHEPFGIAPLEAMASGKPVVAVNEGGYLETVTSDTGVLVEPDVKHIIDGIRLIGQDPAKYKEACIERAKKFDIAFFQEKIHNIVSNCIRKG